MARSDTLYSRVVAWLKVALPLVALGLLATLFLLARGDDPPAAELPYVDGAPQSADRGGLGRPFHAGMTEGGDLVTLRAASARNAGGRVAATDIDARIVLTEGATLTLTAQGASLPDGSRDLTLTDAVTLRSTTGWTVRSDRMRTALDRVAIDSDGPVDVLGPAGTLTAGTMSVRETGPDGAVHLIFTGGVNMLYDPDAAERVPE